MYAKHSCMRNRMIEFLLDAKVRLIADAVQQLRGSLLFLDGPANLPLISCHGLYHQRLISLLWVKLHHSSARNQIRGDIKLASRADPSTSNGRIAIPR